MQVKNDNKYVIQITNGYVVYNHKQNAPFVGLKDFNFNFEKSKIYCIIGKSGSGKSTLISLFNGLNRLNYGSVNLGSISLRSGRDLNNCIISAYKVNDIKIVKDIIRENKTDNNIDYYVIKTTKDAKWYDIESALLTISNNTNKTYYKISPILKSKLHIDNSYNNYYLIKANKYTTDKLKPLLVNDINEFNIQVDNKIKLKGVKKTKRIKNYKILRQEIGMVNQFPEFQLFKYTVLDDVSFGLRVLGTKKIKAIELAKQQLQKLGIKPSHFNNSPFALSGGQKRRVAIAGILAIDGDTLIFDEPTAGLDPVGEKEMIDIILNAKQKQKNIFVVTHSMDQVLEIADEILVLHNQELIAHGNSYDIFNNPKVLKNTNIEQPYVIKVVNNLISKNKKFEILNKLKPKTIEELGQCLVKINKK